MSMLEFMLAAVAAVALSVAAAVSISACKKADDVGRITPQINVYRLPGGGCVALWTAPDGCGGGAMTTVTCPPAEENLTP